MNLRYVHAAMILLSAALAVVLGVWCFGRYGEGAGLDTLVAGIAAFSASAGLVAYDRWFLRKTRMLR